MPEFLVPAPPLVPRFKRSGRVVPPRFMVAGWSSEAGTAARRLSILCNPVVARKVSSSMRVRWEMKNCLSTRPHACEDEGGATRFSWRPPLTEDDLFLVVPLRTWLSWALVSKAFAWAYSTRAIKMLRVTLCCPEKRNHPKVTSAVRRRFQKSGLLGGVVKLEMPGVLEPWLRLLLQSSYYTLRQLTLKGLVKRRGQAFPLHFRPPQLVGLNLVDVRCGNTLLDILRNVADPGVLRYLTMRMDGLMLHFGEGKGAEYSEELAVSLVSTLNSFTRLEKVRGLEPSHVGGLEGSRETIRVLRFNGVEELSPVEQHFRHSFSMPRLTEIHLAYADASVDPTPLMQHEGVRKLALVSGSLFAEDFAKEVRPYLRGFPQLHCLRLSAQTWSSDEVNAGMNSMPELQRLEVRMVGAIRPQVTIQPTGPLVCVDIHNLDDHGRHRPYGPGSETVRFDPQPSTRSTLRRFRYFLSALGATDRLIIVDRKDNGKVLEWKKATLPLSEWVRSGTLDYQLYLIDHYGRPVLQNESSMYVWSPDNPACVI